MICVAKESSIDDQESSSHPFLSDLYESHRGRLLTIADKIVHDRAIAEEVIHDVFLNVITNLSQYRATPGSFRGLLTSMVRSRALDYLRYSKRRPTVGSCDSDDRSYGRTDYRALFPGGEDFISPADHAAFNESKDLLRSAIELVDSDDRPVMEAVYVDGRTFDDAALHLGMPIGSLKTRISRTLRFLRVRLLDRIMYTSRPDGMTGLTIRYPSDV